MKNKRIRAERFVVVGYPALLYEWEDADVGIFKKPFMKDRKYDDGKETFPKGCYGYHDKPICNMIKVFGDMFINEKVRITIEVIE